MINEIKTLIYGIFVYLNIDTEPVMALTVLMLIDTVLGLLKVLTLDSAKFEFKKLILGLFTKPALLLIPITIALMGKGIGYDLRVLVSIGIKVLIVSEGMSIISNFISIRTKEEVKDHDIITKFLKKTRNFFMSIVDKLLKLIGKDTDK